MPTAPSIAVDIYVLRRSPTRGAGETILSQDLMLVPTQGGIPAIIDGSDRKARDGIEHFLRAAILRCAEGYPHVDAAFFIMDFCLCEAVDQFADRSESRHTKRSSRRPTDQVSVYI